MHFCSQEVFFGIIVGIIEPFKKIASMSKIVLNAQRRWSLYAITGLVIFTLISSLPMILLPFKM